ncbi:MAG: hypothetical protein PWP71_2712, partial [Clostridia bacterium]|nr:hypothetical protein [Clostridia bacterium]
IPYWKESSYEIYPNINNHEIYEKYFGVYKKIYPYTKEILHDLTDISIN